MYKRQVVGAAKGIQRMARAIEDVLGDVITDGHVIGKYGDSVDCLLYTSGKEGLDRNVLRRIFLYGHSGGLDQKGCRGGVDS